MQQNATTNPKHDERLLPLQEGTNVRHSLYARYGKRILDIGVSAAGLLVFSPVMALIAALVKLDSPGAVLYRGPRAGFRGLPFTQYKFRTMVADAEQRGGRKTTSNDERITRVGRFLRATKLDELPQLINVLRGEMSLVGPRPMVEEEVDGYTPWERRALEVRPGITDWASVRFHNEEQILGSIPDWQGYYERYVRPEKSWLRVAYAEACSLRTDLAILRQTASVLLSTRLAWSETADHQLVFIPWGLRVRDLPEYLLAPRSVRPAELADEPATAPLGHVSLVVPTAVEEAQLRNLLASEPVQPDVEAIRAIATGETVLVTGAGGSIGSELCRQIARLAPKRLVALGHGEHSISELMREFEQAFPTTDIQPVIADVRDRERLRQVFEEHRPYSVFHAAGHKHVPLLEDSIREAVTSNVLGTKNAAALANEYGVQHFILLSTVKAVRPSSVLGVSKRVAELVVQNLNDGGDRSFAAVRLCNVLGSRSSVMPTFLSQIRAGGPVTVTHRDMRRHFILLPDAAVLVLESAALGGDGDLFAVQLGEPVRILDLASALVRAHGQERGKKVEIRFTGIRPGERLDEETLQDLGSTEPTRHPKIRRITVGRPGPEIARDIDRLIESATDGRDDEELRVLLTHLVPDFVPDTITVPQRPPTARVYVA